MVPAISPAVDEAGSALGKVEDSIRAQEHQREQMRCQTLWDEHISRRSKFQQYRHTVVLLLSWEESDFNKDELTTEIEDLADVFQQSYGFEVQKRVLDSTRNPAKWLNKYFSDLLCDHDEEETLFIIYYAGHGWSSTSKQKNVEQATQFFIAGRATPLYPGLQDKASVAWHQAERVLLPAESADILVIFDCCDAGSLLGMRGGPRFEYLVACGAGEVTYPPGERSFTRALIWALKEFKDSETLFFTTTDLRAKLVDAPGFPKHQIPCTFQRAHALDLITLAPRGLPSWDLLPDSKSQNYGQSVACLNLQFQFDSQIDDKVLKQVATALSRLLGDGSLLAKRISFLEKYSLASSRWSRAICQVRERINMLKLNTEQLEPLRAKDGPVAASLEGRALELAATERCHATEITCQEIRAPASNTGEIDLASEQPDLAVSKVNLGHDANSDSGYCSSHCDFMDISTRTSPDSGSRASSVDLDSPIVDAGPNGRPTTLQRLRTRDQRPLNPSIARKDNLQNSHPSVASDVPATMSVAEKKTTTMFQLHNVQDQSRYAPVMTFSADNTTEPMITSENSPRRPTVVARLLVSMLKSWINGRAKSPLIHNMTGSTNSRQPGANELGQKNARTQVTGESSQRSPRDRKQASSKRPRDESDDEEDRRRRRKKDKAGPLNRSDGKNDQKLACPFRKHSPFSYKGRRLRSCLGPGPGWDNMSRIKQHLYDCHMRKPQCDRCGECFETQTKVHDHLQKPDSCPKRRVSRQDAIDSDTERRLKSRKGLANMCTHEQWLHAYKILFPAEESNTQPLPSPYQDSDLLESEIEDFLLAVECELLSTIPEHMTGITPQALAHLQSAVQRVQDQRMGTATIPAWFRGQIAPFPHDADDGPSDFAADVDISVVQGSLATSAVANNQEGSGYSGASRVAAPAYHLDDMPDLATTTDEASTLFQFSMEQFNEDVGSWMLGNEFSSASGLPMDGTIDPRLTFGDRWLP